MDVKDVSGAFATPPVQEVREQYTGVDVKPVTVKGDSVTVSYAAKDRSLSTAAPRMDLNSFISALNIASEAAGTASEIISSISGIVGQAEQDSLAENRRAALEREARELANELKKLSDKTTPAGTKPLSGQPIRAHIEEKVEQDLQMVVPDHAKDAFGLSASISLSSREAIVQTRAAVEVAKQRAEELTISVKRSRLQMEESLKRLELAITSTQAAAEAVGNVETAQRVASSTKETVVSKPKEALSSFGSLEHIVQSLLD